jgi:signal transduction histidine kinase
MLRSVLDRVSDCYLRVDGDLKISEVNVAASRWVGAAPDDLLGRGLFEVFYKAPAVEQAAVANVIGSGKPWRIEIASRTHPGRWVEADFHPFAGETTILFRDVTERKNAELAGEKARDLMTSALDATASEIAILDEAGRVLIANQAWHRFMANTGRYHQDNGIGALYLDLGPLHPAKPQLHAFRCGMRAVLAGERQEFTLDFRTKVRGRYRSYRLRLIRMQSNSWNRILVSRDDVTELQTALSEMDDMAVRLVNLQERERQKYAVELHDSTVQHLTAASLNLMALRNRLRGNGEDAVVAAVEESVSEAQREIRSVSYLLYPRELDEDGLCSTLARFTSGYAMRTQIDARLTTRGPIDGLPLSLQRSVMRIVQEAMANVHRHADAGSVWVSVGADRHRLSVSVSDDGRGLAKNRAGCVQCPGVGISGMKARAHQFGGCLKVRSAGRGTLVFARIPLPCGAAGESDPSLH